MTKAEYISYVEQNDPYGVLLHLYNEKYGKTDPEDFMHNLKIWQMNLQFGINGKCTMDYVIECVTKRIENQLDVIRLYDTKGKLLKVW